MNIQILPASWSSLCQKIVQILKGRKEQRKKKYTKEENNGKKEKNMVIQSDANKSFKNKKITLNLLKSCSKTKQFRIKL